MLQKIDVKQRKIVKCDWSNEQRQHEVSQTNRERQKDTDGERKVPV